MSTSDNIIENNLVLKELVEILNDILNILPYEVYRIHHGINIVKNNFVIGIGGVTDIREIGDLFMSMNLGDEADKSSPGASFYIRKNREGVILDSSHDLEKIISHFKKHDIGEENYTIKFDTYLGNITISINNSVLNIS